MEWEHQGPTERLGEAFLAALHEDFEKHGAATVQKVREERPHEYLKIIAGILPKELSVNTSRLDELSDHELAAGIAALESIIAAQVNADGDENMLKPLRGALLQ